MVKIVLDAGHGGSDPGAVYEGRQEKDDNLQLVFDVGAVLENNGIDVEYTRVTDVYQSPYEKAAMANQSGADYFVSIHRNARDIPNTEGGVETLLYSTEDSVKRDMAEAINRNLEGLGFANRGVIARPNLVVLRDTDMPALLVEAGFIDSEADNALYDANRAAIADAIAYGILAGLPETAEQSLTYAGAGTGGNTEYGNGADEENYGSDEDGRSKEREPGVRIGNQNSERVIEDRNRDSGNDTGERGRNNGSAPEEENGIPGGDEKEKNHNGNDSGEKNNNNESDVREKDSHHESDGRKSDGREKNGNYGNDTGKNDWKSYRVQVGVYRNPSNARTMRNRLEIRGHQAYMLYRNGLYYVQAGAYPDLASAVAEERRLKRAGIPTMIVAE